MCPAKKVLRGASESLRFPLSLPCLLCAFDNRALVCLSNSAHGFSPLYHAGLKEALPRVRPAGGFDFVVLFEPIGGIAGALMLCSDDVACKSMKCSASSSYGNV